MLETRSAPEEDTEEIRKKVEHYAQSIKYFESQQDHLRFYGSQKNASVFEPYFVNDEVRGSEIFQRGEPGKYLAPARYFARPASI